jgi:hypothetical protein
MYCHITISVSYCQEEEKLSEIWNHQLTFGFKTIELIGGLHFAFKWIKIWCKSIFDIRFNFYYKSS